jgi:hypothetical protein
MTNVSETPEKVAIRKALFRTALKALEKKGWTVERIAGAGKSSVRRITKGTTAKTVSIRTTQDRSIAFPRNAANNGWETLSEVDYVVAASVDDRDNPRFGLVHLIEGDEMRARFDRTYAARKKAGHVLPKGRGVWLSLYNKEANDPVHLVGAGAGLAYPPIAREPLAGEKTATVHEDSSNAVDSNDAPLTIPEAKRRLALSLGVNEADIKITISS